MRIGNNPQLYLSDPLYDITLKTPELESANFNYMAYDFREMNYENQESAIFRDATIKWSFVESKDLNNLNKPITLDPNEKSGFSQEDISKVVDVSFFSVNSSIQLILEDTQPETRFDPDRYQVNFENTIDLTPIKSDFLNALKTKIDGLNDDADDLTIYSAYIDSIIEITDSNKLDEMFSGLKSYLKSATEQNNQILNSLDELSNNGTSSQKTPSGLKFKLSLNDKFAPSLAAGAISTQGPFSTELSSLLGRIKIKRNNGQDEDISKFAYDTQKITKNELFDSNNRLKQTFYSIIRKLSYLFTGGFIDTSGAYEAQNDDQSRELKSAYQKLFKSKNDNDPFIVDINSQLVLNSISEELGNNLFKNFKSMLTDFVSVVGFRINRTELRPDISGGNNVTTFKSDPIFIFNSIQREFTDSRIRYGSVYDYSVSTIYEMKIPFVSQSGGLYYKKVFVASEPSNSIRLVAEDFSIVNPPPNISIERLYENGQSKTGVLISWDHPADIKEKIRGFRVYRRSSNMKEPFELIRELRFRKVPGSHLAFIKQDEAIANSLAPSGIVEDSSNENFASGLPKRNYFDQFYRNNREYIYTVTTVDMHGNESSCADQVTFDFENGQENVIIRGCPIDYPNLYLDYRKVIDSQISTNIKRNEGKAAIFLDPVGRTISNNLNYMGQSFFTGKQDDSQPVLNESILKNNLTAFNCSVEKSQGRNENNQLDGTHAFIFTAEGGVLFNGESAEYDFIIFDEENKKTAVLRTNIEFGNQNNSEIGDIESNFFE